MPDATLPETLRLARRRLVPTEHDEQDVPWLVFVLPEPPSFNGMLDLAKQRTRRSRTGGWMKRSLPVVYDQALEAYELECVAALRRQRVRPPRDPWPYWRLVSAHFRLHNERDWTEVLASLKWPVDVLVRLRYVADDSPREMAPPPTPTQEIDRRNRGVTLHIARLDVPPTRTIEPTTREEG